MVDRLISQKKLKTFLFLRPQERGTVAKYCDELSVSVCLSVHEDISRTTCAIFTNFSLHVAYGRGSVLLQQGDKIPRGRAVLRHFLPH